MIIRTARPRRRAQVNPGDVRVLNEQLVGPACPGTLNDELAAGNTSERVSSLAAYPATVANDVHLFRIRCGGCGAEWAGEDRAHCAGCHTIFDSIVLFDVHRDGGSCLRPQVLGLVATKNGIWRAQASNRCGRVIPNGRAAVAGAPLDCRRRRVARCGRSVAGGPVATAALPCSALELGATH